MAEKVVHLPTKKPTVQGTAVGMRIPSKLLARIDAIVAKQPDPKPRRGQVIKMLVREALNAREARHGAAKPDEWD